MAYNEKPDPLIIEKYALRKGLFCIAESKCCGINGLNELPILAFHKTTEYMNFLVKNFSN